MYLEPIDSIPLDTKTTTSGAKKYIYLLMLIIVVGGFSGTPMNHIFNQSKEHACI
jgi:hypothetical protein